MARSRQDVRQFISGQELVASERLFGHRGRKGRNDKDLPKKEDKTGEQDPKEEKCGWGPDYLFHIHICIRMYSH